MMMTYNICYVNYSNNELLASFLRGLLTFLLRLAVKRLPPLSIYIINNEVMTFHNIISEYSETRRVIVLRI